MIKAIIIEDEQFAIERLKMLLSKMEDVTIGIIAEINSTTDAVEWLNNHQADLIFLDIHLADGNAFKIFEQVEIKTPIIFTTAYHEYALRAFEQFSIDYLLKPVSPEKLRNSIQKFQTLTSSSSAEQETTTLPNLQELANFIKTTNQPKRFLVNIGNKVKVVETTDIAYFTSFDKITFLYTFDKKKYTIDFSLKKLEATLSPDDFFRINRQYLVHRTAIDHLHYLSTTRIQVNLNPPASETVILARDKIGVFKDWLAG